MGQKIEEKKKVLMHHKTIKALGERMKMWDRFSISQCLTLGAYADFRKRDDKLNSSVAPS